MFISNILEHFSEIGKGPGGSISSPCVYTPKIALSPVCVRAWASSSDDTLKFPHSHRKMVLKVVLSGSITTFCDGTAFPMRAGDAILFFPYQIHSSAKVSGTDYRFFAVTFTDRYNDYETLLPLKNRIFPISSADEQVLLNLLEGLRGQNDTVKDATVSEMVLLLGRKMSENEMRLFPHSEENTLFNRICAWIRENRLGNDGISVKLLADNFGVCPMTLRRIFLKNCGITPGEILRKFRFQEACMLLESSNASLAEIAQKCGYADVFSFSRAFAASEHIPPSLYRKKHRQ